MAVKGIIISEQEQAQIRTLAGQGMSSRSIGRQVGLHHSTVQDWMRKLAGVTPPPCDQETKKVGEFDLDEWLNWMEDGQALKNKASWSQKQATITLGDGKTPQIICPQGDWHVCSWGTDHSLVRQAIKEITETPNAWFPLMGDMIQMSIKMRSVLEVSDNLIPPQLQTEFLEQLLAKIAHKVPFSVWCNHGVEREEKQSGVSMVKHILSRAGVYFNGIGHIDIRVGDQIYPFAASHKWRGSSMFDTTFGMKRYARMEANDREIILGADNHQPGISTYFEGGMKRIALRCGTFQTNSGYAGRYFTPLTWPVMPTVVLFPDKHRAVACENMQHALETIGQG